MPGAYCSVCLNAFVRTTLEISDALFERAKRLAKREGRPMRGLVEDGLRLLLDAEKSAAAGYQLPDASIGEAGAPNPLESLSWQHLRAEIYGGP